MRMYYTKPELKDLSQGARIAFVRQFRKMTQDDVALKLGVEGANRRRIMTRYEKGQRNPNEDRTLEISQILNVNYNAIKRYDFKDPVDICYILLWLDELMPKYKMDIPNLFDTDNNNVDAIKKVLSELEIMRNKRSSKEISYEDYIEWKIGYEVRKDG